MKTLPYKLNTGIMITRLQDMNEGDRFLAIENLMNYWRDKVIFVTDLLKISDHVKVSVDLILTDIWLLKTEPQLFEYGKKLEQLERVGFLERSKVIRFNMNKQLELIYKNQIQ